MGELGLIEAATMFGGSLDNQWTFLFTIALAAVGFLATLRQAFSADARAERRYHRTARVIQIALALFLANGFGALYAIYARLNVVLATIREEVRAGGGSPALADAFTPYVLWPEELGMACPVGKELICQLNLPSSLYAYVVAAIILVLLTPWIAGCEPQDRARR